MLSHCNLYCIHRMIYDLYTMKDIKFNYRLSSIDYLLYYLKVFLKVIKASYITHISFGHYLKCLY